MAMLQICSIKACHLMGLKKHTFSAASTALWDNHPRDTDDQKFNFVPRPGVNVLYINGDSVMFSLLLLFIVQPVMFYFMFSISLTVLIVYLDFISCPESTTIASHNTFNETNLYIHAYISLHIPSLGEGRLQGSQPTQLLTPLMEQHCSRKFLLCWLLGKELKCGFPAGIGSRMLWYFPLGW